MHSGQRRRRIQQVQVGLVVVEAVEAEAGYLHRQQGPVVRPDAAQDGHGFGGLQQVAGFQAQGRGFVPGKGGPEARAHAAVPARAARGFHRAVVAHVVGRGDGAGGIYQQARGHPQLPQGR